MSHLSTTFRVGASPDIVFDLVADPARGPEWQTMITEMGAISGRPGGVGSSYVGFYRVAGRRIEGRFVVTAAERPTLHQAAGTTRGGWARWTTMIEPIDEGSEVRVEVEFELPGEVIGSLFGLLAGRLEEEFRKTYDNLRELAEAEARGGRRPTPLPGPDADTDAELDTDVEGHVAGPIAAKAV
jgi:ribosome-associated toxin RatA of RatAB toxin-antitoxin module